jgi:signal recognition particle subunit SRP54
VLESLQDKFQKSLKVLRGEAKIRPAHIESALEEIKQSLLEADVQFKVAQKFLERVKAKALGAEVVGSLTPYQQFLYILQKEMLEIFGEQKEFSLQFKPPVVIFLVGLQGSGKTTSSSKLAFLAKRKLKKKPLLVSVDVQRPAAIEQLERHAKDAKVDYLNPASMDPVVRAQAALEYAKTYGLDLLIVDTAGRLSIDEVLMNELKTLQSALQPQHILYVADAMSGQAGLQVAEGFSEKLGLTGAILTKSDADARGGVALSIREALGVPLYFVGMGEKLEDFELFHADRWVSRILGQGDLKSLIEKVEEVTQEEQQKGRRPEKMASRAMKGQLNLVDFQEQMKMMSKMGSMKGLLGMIPGMGAMTQQIDTMALEKKLKRVDAMICSMTPKEREQPDILNGTRKRRIALGSGTQVEEINQFLKEFWEMQKMLKGLKGMRGLKGMGKLFG